ncbi:chlamydia polymorphic membrane middle domain protein, partial [Chlamydia psittaci 06-1683]
CLL